LGSWLLDEGVAAADLNNLGVFADLIKIEFAPGSFQVSASLSNSLAWPGISAHDRALRPLLAQTIASQLRTIRGGLIGNSRDSHARDTSASPS
jgi:hypothetical protein